MNKRINALGAVGIIVVFGAILACSKKKDSDSSSSGGGVVSYVGSWTGLTSQSHTMSLNVVTGGVSMISFSYSLNGNFCSLSGNAVVNYSTGTPVAITSGHFADTSGNPKISGTFSSASSASGTIQVYDSYCDGTANVTWTASKTASSPTIPNQQAGIAPDINAVTFHEDNKSVTISRHTFGRQGTH